MVAPVLAVAAVDSYVESATEEAIHGRRPDSWNGALRKSFGIQLPDLLGEENYRRLDRVRGVRNALAHGDKFRDTLPEDVRDQERRFEEHAALIDPRLALPPYVVFCLSESLRVIRSIRRFLRLGRCPQES